MKRVVSHTKACKRKTNGGCPICKQLIALCCYHAKLCQVRAIRLYLTSVADPGSGAFLTQGSGMGKNPRSGYWIWDEHPWSYFRELWCGPGSGIWKPYYPGSVIEKFGSGINIPDPQHCLTGPVINCASFLKWDSNSSLISKPLGMKSDPMKLIRYHRQIG